MAVPTGSVHAHILMNPCRAVVLVSRLDLVEPGAAKCVFRGMAGACFKSLERIISLRFFLFWKKICHARGRNPTLGRPNHLGRVPQKTISDTVRPALLMEARRGSAVDVVGAAPGSSI